MKLPSSSSYSSRLCLFLCALFAYASASAFLAGCSAYPGGRIVDGTNLEIGMTVPGTNWSVNFLSYVGGVVVKGDDFTRITVTNTVTETNSYFGVVRTQRHSSLVATIIPVERTAAKPPDAEDSAPSAQPAAP